MHIRVGPTQIHIGKKWRNPFDIQTNPPMNSDEYNSFPDIRDGLTRKERIVLTCIDQLQKERDGRNISTAMLYGRVVEYLDMSEDELQLILQRLSNCNHRC